MRGRSMAVLLVWAVSAPAMAQQVFDGATARQMAFNAGRAELVVRPHPSMSAAEAGAFDEVADTLVRQIPYYGAIAISPDEGVNAAATIAAGNFHSFDAAAAAVLAECDAKRRAGSQPCAVVAEVRPQGWEARALQLSQGATAALRGDYRRGGGEKALAISPASGGFGVGKGAGAGASALAACNAAGGRGDCSVVVAD